jgi:hypothetical protein
MTTIVRIRPFAPSPKRERITCTNTIPFWGDFTGKLGIAVISLISPYSRILSAIDI